MRRYDPLKPIGGFRHQPKGWFERLIHHKYAFPVISVVGGGVLVLGTVLLFLNPSSANRSAAVKPFNTPVRDVPAAAASPTPAAALTVTSTPGPQRTYAAAPAFTIDPSATYTATLKTDKGDVTIQLDPKSAPQTVNNFVFLAQNHFYDGLSFQRVVPGFVAQAGAPNPDGTGGPGYTVPDEDSPLKHDTGAVAMAESSSTPNSSGSQFYVALSPLSQQDGHDTVFGKVTSGLNVLTQLSRHDPNDPRTQDALKITSVSVGK
jgi:cyclophilin family peptidyl-prolyl cis-trans isomerase